MIGERKGFYIGLIFSICGYMRWISIILLIMCIWSIPCVSAAGSEPVSAFSASPVSGSPPLTVEFTDLSQGSPISWLWSFGDGGSSTAQNPVHIYQNEGIYDVTLVTTNAYGQSTSQRVKYIRVGLEPTPNFVAAPLVGPPPHKVHFSDKSTGNPTSWVWDFGDGSTSTEQNPVHVYTGPGRYDITLRVSNVVGTVDRIKEQYILVGHPPEAMIGVSQNTGSAPLVVQLTDRSQGNPYSWLWSFGDGGNSIDQNPSHTYISPGSYTVRLTVENLFGTDTATYSTDIVVTPPATVTPAPTMGPSPSGVIPIANFTGSPRTGNAPLTVKFTDTSTGGATWWRWNFGDGLLSSEMSPIHTYESPGNYSVGLVVRNDYSIDSKTEVEYIVVISNDPIPGVTDTPFPAPTPPMDDGKGVGVGSVHPESQREGLESEDASSRDATGFLANWWWLIVLLIIAISAVAGYYWWNNSRKSPKDGWF